MTPAAPPPPSGRKRTRGLQIATISRAPIVLTPGWGLIAVVLVVIFAPLVSARMDVDNVIVAGLIAAGIPVLLAVSVLAHELAHGQAARALGYDVHEYVISLWGGHTAFARDIDRPGPSAVVAVVGPLANAVIAGACWWILSASLWNPVAYFLLSSVALTNGLVAAFNLVPASPLDGGRLLEALIWRLTGDRYRAMRISGRCGQATAIALGLGVLGVPYLRGGEPELTTAIWGILIAAVIWQGASTSIKVATARQSALGLDLRHYLHHVQVLPETATVARVHRVPALVLDSQQRPIGLIDGRALSAVPEPDRDRVGVGAVLDASTPVAVMTEPAGPPAVAQLARIMQRGSNQRPTVVLWQEDTVGIVDVPLVLQLLNTGR